MQTIRKGTSTYTYDPRSVTVTINGMEITGFSIDEFTSIFSDHKFKQRGSRQEVFVRDNEEGRKMFMAICTIMDKDIDMVQSKGNWTRVRPAFNEREMSLIKNYLKMTEV